MKKLNKNINAKDEIEVHSNIDNDLNDNKTKLIEIVKDDNKNNKENFKYPEIIQHINCEIGIP